jgi:hypothetical protein
MVGSQALSKFLLAAYAYVGPCDSQDALLAVGACQPDVAPVILVRAERTPDDGEHETFRFDEPVANGRSSFGFHGMLDWVSDRSFVTVRILRDS